MILVDTSVWVDHLRANDATLVNLLGSNQVSIHPFVVGELACGNLSNRTEILNLLQDLPQATVASDKEVLFLIEHHELMGRGIGYVDTHLLAAVTLSRPAVLWTRDRRLRAAAETLGVAYSE
jgi:predicted nucleic acid-binding protein